MKRTLTRALLDRIRDRHQTVRLTKVMKPKTPNRCKKDDGGRRKAEAVDPSIHPSISLEFKLWFARVFKTKINLNSALLAQPKQFILHPSSFAFILRPTPPAAA